MNRPPFAEWLARHRASLLLTAGIEGHSANVRAQSWMTANKAKKLANYDERDVNHTLQD